MTGITNPSLLWRAIRKIRNLCLDSTPDLRQVLPWTARVRIDETFLMRVAALHRELGIPRGYFRRNLPLCPEAADLIDTPSGPQRELRRMTPTTYAQWSLMRASAASAGIDLYVRWSFRSLDEQADLIRERLAKGRPLREVLTWVAAPGYSEHHTGRALDIGSTECDLTDAYDQTQTFAWLQREAGKFGFHMSYPPGNSQRIVYEPWHWCLGEDFKAR